MSGLAGITIEIGGYTNHWLPLRSVTNLPTIEPLHYYLPQGDKLDILINCYLLQFSARQQVYPSSQSTSVRKLDPSLNISIPVLLEQVNDHTERLSAHPPLGLGQPL